MKGFATYAAELTSLALRASSPAADSATDTAAAAALNGDAAAHLRDLVALADRRAAGAFFTSTELAERAWSQVAATLDAKSVVLDPTCGAGSLLLPALPSLAKFSTTADELGSKVYGLDLSREFTQAARARLALSLLQIAKTNAQFCSVRPSLFQHVRRADLYSRSADFYSKFSHVAINPPYTMEPAPSWFDLSTGKVNSAALMVAYCLERMRPGARMVAILPDVLKSGTRYGKWRRFIEDLSIIEDISQVGQFDQQTDVHVFIMQLRKKTQSEISHNAAEIFDTNRSADNTVGDFFAVSVGTVVQHRHAEIGPSRPFVDSKGLREVTRAEDLPARRFSGRCVEPPFVAVRRTSRPGEPTRARPAVVTGAEPVAVDNHLLVVRPHDGALDACHELAAWLRKPESTNWLDEHYRCRHLTVGALKSLPLANDDHKAES